MRALPSLRKVVGLEHGALNFIACLILQLPGSDARPLNSKAASGGLSFIPCTPMQVAVQAELYGNALSLQRRVMDELLQHIFAAYNACLIDKLAGGARSEAHIPCKLPQAAQGLLELNQGQCWSFRADICFVDIGAGGALQLLAELQYFSQALGPALRPPRDQLLDQAKARLLREDRPAGRSGRVCSGGGA